MGLKIACCTNVWSDILLPFPYYIFSDYLEIWHNICFGLPQRIISSCTNCVYICLFFFSLELDKIDTTQNFRNTTCTRVTLWVFRNTWLEEVLFLIGHSCLPYFSDYTGTTNVCMYIPNSNKIIHKQKKIQTELFQGKSGVEKICTYTFDSGISGRKQKTQKV